VSPGPGQAEQTGLGSRDISHNALGISKIGDERFIRTPDGELVSQKGGTPGHRYYQLDRLGSVRQQTNTSGTVVTQTTYDPYGRSLGPNHPGDPGLWFGYTGKQTDTAGLVHNGQRFYSPDHMRWTQPDPLTQPADLRQANRYAYAAGCPTNLVDPSGERNVRVLRRVLERARRVLRLSRAEVAICIDAAVEAFERIPPFVPGALGRRRRASAHREGRVRPRRRWTHQELLCVGSERVGPGSVAASTTLRPRMKVRHAELVEAGTQWTEGIVADEAIAVGGLAALRSVVSSSAPAARRKRQQFNVADDLRRSRRATAAVADRGVSRASRTPCRGTRVVVSSESVRQRSATAA
jgi:RHS repeat-associated protein